MRRPWIAASSALSLGLLLLAMSCGGSSAPSESMPPPTPPPPPALTQLSSDTFTNPQSQHATEVEPGMASSGSTLVTAFQVGRIFGGGAAAIGFATSANAGGTWSNGFLPGLTKAQGNGPYNAASDPSVAYDKSHNVWLIASLAIASGSDIVVVSRSADARTWTPPVTVSSTHDADKQWIACDNDAASAFYGHCYIEWDDPSKPANGLIWMSTSSDGGRTWSAAANTADSATGLGGQPVVGANGLVIVPIENADGTQMLAFTSADGGATWSRTVMISTITDHAVAGNLRTSALPSAAVDASGRVYVVWQDCRFRANCSSNDIVLSTSTDGSNWSAPVGVPIDAVSGTVDHFIPGLAADASTSGASARLALTYYFYPNAACTTATCQLEVGSVTSSDGGNTWSAPTMQAGPMQLAWLPNTSSGLMVGDYIATSYSNGHAYSVFAVARAGSGGAFDEAIFTTASPLAQGKRAVRPAMRAEVAVTRRSDHPPRKFFDLDHEHPIPQRKK